MSYAEIKALEEEVDELKSVIRDMEDDAIFILSKLIEIRYMYSTYEDLAKELKVIIKLHSQADRAKAKALILGEDNERVANRYDWDSLCSGGSRLTIKR